MLQLILVPVLLLSGGAASSGSDQAALERALATIRPTSICADVRFIASDELAGRDTPSPGQRLAARYIVARLERLGFQPGGDAGFFDQYKLTSTGLDAEQSGVELQRGGETTKLAYGRDAMVFDVRASDVAGPLTYVGLGKAEDFEGLALAGRWAVALSSREVRWSERSRSAAAAGAIGLVVVPDPAGDPAKDRWSDSLPSRSTIEGSEDDTRGPSLPQLYLSRAASKQLIGDAAPARGTKIDVVLRDHRVAGATSETILENVCGFWPGSDPALSKEVLILSAHYDHVGVNDGEIYNGADDNGSGTSGLLALAEALKSYGPMRRSVLLLWVSGEEKGLWGSAAWTKNPTLPAGYKAVADVNIDMIGRNEPGKLLITPTKELKEYNGLTRLAESLSPLEGFPKLGSCDEYWKRSDHMNFAENLGIPVAFLFSDVHEDYHKPTDDADKIDCDKIHRVVRLVLRMLDALQGDQLSL